MSNHRKQTLIGAVFQMLPSPAMTGKRLQLGQWLTFSDYGEAARRNMTTSWICVAILALVESVWLPMSTLSLGQDAWPELANSLFYGALAYIFHLVVSHRLRNKEDRIAIFLGLALERLGLLFRGCILVAAIGGVGLIFTYLATALALPLYDPFLARLDGELGFHWLSFLSTINDRPLLADVLVRAYKSTGPLTQGVVIWLSIRGRGERLSEFLALLCLSSIGLAVGMLLAPAAGAFVYFEPAQRLFDSFSAAGEMWPFQDAFNGLRDGSLTKIDVSAVQGVVSFPSFHTMLGVITTYALRDTRALLIPAIALNGTMIVATLPVGGHYLTDVLAGAAITIAAIYAVRHVSGRGALSRPPLINLSANEIA